MLKRRPILPDQAQLAVHPVRRRAVESLSFVEDVVYLGLGVLLTITAVALLVVAVKSAAVAVLTGSLRGQAIVLLDQILLILVVVELLYTVQVSFRVHGLAAEPFLVVALIATIRRVLVLTAEAPQLPQATEEVFRRAMFELGLLTVMVVVFVVSLILLQKHAHHQRT